MQGAEYVYETNWGEQLSSVVHPLPVVLNLNTEECTVLDTSEIGDISCKHMLDSYILTTTPVAIH